MKKGVILLIIVAFSFDVSAQNETAMKFAGTITKEDLYGHLSILASDALEGRETGKRGQKMAAAYIRAHFQALGLRGPLDGKYFQAFNLEKSSPSETYVMVGTEKKINGKDILYWGKNTTNGEITIPAVYVGNANHLDKLDLQDKAVIMTLRGSFSLFREKKEEAMKKGASLVIINNTESQEELDELITSWQNFIMRSSLGFEAKKGENTGGVIFMSPENTAAILGTKVEKLDKVVKEQEEGGELAHQKIKEGKITYKTTRIVQTVQTENVLGFLEGTDKKDEIVVVTAHYDHIGIKDGKINNGADDDGSGTSSLLEIAEAFVKAKEEGNGPRRSMLFMTVTGEEKGLLGSQYYVENPVFPLENTVVDLNIDMIGRIDPEHEDNTNYVYLVGSDRLSSELHEISEKVNDTFTQFDLDYTYNKEDHKDRIYYRSDHWNFAKNNVPIIFYFNG
ncbi:MAG: M28 family peptidase, partial [Cyclobacteriaceae bacterium]|nr:M28 family peptidase [Cyclobacteriaceae bacterium]